MMTFNILEYCRALELPLVFSSTREVYGDVHRFEEYGEDTADFAYTESPYSASKIGSEGFIYSYAKCYGLSYLVFRFSNVYGRYDNDLQRMERVLPLFIHQLARGEPITVYGGEEKVLDFTYIDDCVDGIVRGVERLAAGQVENETINLAFGQGNTLVKAAELIAGELGVTPEIAYKPSLRGEVTHYVADIRKARELLDWQPQTPLEAGIPRAVEWFRSWRTTHPDEERRDRPRARPRRDRARVQADDRLGDGSRRRRALRPDGQRQERRRRPRRRAARRRGRLGRLGGALRRHPAPDRGAPLTRPPRRRRPARAMTSRSGPTSASRTPRSTRSSPPAASPSSPAAPASTCGRRSRRSSSRRPRRRECASAGAGSTTRLGAEEAHAVLARIDPAAAARVHPNDRRRVVRALELDRRRRLARARRKRALGGETPASRRSCSGSTCRSPSSTRGSMRASRR